MTPHSGHPEADIGKFLEKINTILKRGDVKYRIKDNILVVEMKKFNELLKDEEHRIKRKLMKEKIITVSSTTFNSYARRVYKIDLSAFGNLKKGKEPSADTLSQTNREVSPHDPPQG